MENPSEDLTAVFKQDTPSNGGGASSSPETRALHLLASLREEQAGLPRSEALAWERAVFREAFRESGPAQRIQTFLERKRREE